ncbi:hypothetical protein D1AOALGA4SA_1710 [Olavius algarvensis Delta 1 endosymbiont]|nr:hypothetical protein D1AOALGA4SA_1710 [Olavius algarvensis Delta 1 endosymbiont]
MENQILTGIGCFAGPEKLGRVFKRMVQTYTLGKLNGIEWDQDWESDGSEGTKLLKALIAGPAARQSSAGPEAGDRLENKKITGFFLTLKGQRLKLSVFAKIGDRRQERHSAILDGITRLRQKRLN